MNKRLWLLLIGFHLGFCAFAQKTIEYPSYTTTLKHFFSNYSADERPKKGQLPMEVKFYKKPDGWHVRILDPYNSDQTIKEALFWKRETGQFVELELKKREDNFSQKDLEYFVINEQLKKYTAAYESKYFKICPYYGYEGWYKDVITNYKEREDLSDTTLYALGRAYSAYASGLLHNNSGMQSAQDAFDLGKDGKLDEEQLMTYRFYRHKAIEQFQKVVDQNPAFSTIVGPITTKRWNESLTAYLDLLMYKNEEEAKKEIQAELYNDGMIAMAKNYLMPCKPNSILLTNGDNDTYPLLYVQSKLNYRSDVLVVNLSLLNTLVYFNRIQEDFLEAKGMNFSLDESQFINDKYSYIRILKEEERTVFLQEIIDEIKKDTSTSSLRAYSIPSKQLGLKIEEDSIQWEAKASYFLRNHILLLDFMANNESNRPLHFTSSMSSSSYLSLDNYLKHSGLIMDIGVEAKAYEDGYRGELQIDDMYANLMHNFDWSGLKTSQLELNRFAKTYRFLFGRLTSELLEKDRKREAEAALSKCTELFPNELYPYERYMISIASGYYELGNNSEANAILELIAQNLSNGMDEISAKDAKLSIQSISSLANQNGEIKLADKLKNMAEAILLLE